MRHQIIRHFNLMKSLTEQNSYLCGLISVSLIQRRRLRNVEAEANLREASYSYRKKKTVDEEVDLTDEIEVEVACATPQELFSLMKI
ncbi:hypothetical protein QE152_g39788 [Popillia japonica]|uniref:Uncharacterized protein n=1 Tax=Popillia japonica TaxID=7064 RepID=A0AAW1HTB0_POPJA